LRNTRKLKEPYEIALANGSARVVHIEGNILVYSKLKLHGATCLPRSGWNMLSVGQMMTDSNVLVLFDSIVRIRCKSYPIRGKIIQFVSDKKQSDSESDKNNPNPTPIRADLEETPSDPTNISCDIFF